MLLDYDFFKNDEALQSIPVIGPSAKGAQLEGSKAFSKAFMAKRNIPTAGYQEFTQATIEEGLAYIEQQTPPIVLKADGLAAGKGVLILTNFENKRRAPENAQEITQDQSEGIAKTKKHNSRTGRQDRLLKTYISRVRLPTPPLKSR